MAESGSFVSLYRRFRPGKFSELRGQPNVAQALRRAVSEEQVAHAYLFVGPRGTGKTSSARILAKALNCADLQNGEPCGQCASCVDIARGASPDVYEMDAASNSGVDAMRDLVAHVALGTPGRWKVYIIDEVHMLSAAAANALLKTLEEPPPHVVFVLATTEPQKVPSTIQSRTQRYEFQLLSAETLTELVADVSAAANLGLDTDALGAAVRRGRGSARDALSALDQVAAMGGAEGLRPGVAPLIGALEQGDPAAALAAVSHLCEAGWGPQQLATELIDELRRSFLSTFAPDLAGTESARSAERAQQMGLPRLVRAIEGLGRSLTEMRDAPDPRVVLEVALVRLIRPELDGTGAALADRMDRMERTMTELLAGRQPQFMPATGVQDRPAPAPSASSQPGLGALRRQREAAAAMPQNGGAKRGAPPGT